ncbi:efflux RND transporter permease subunit [Pseudomonas orientalis]|uniref:efflux RND transporter permease subunit n=1 Tax=Pseudomonas orientalis TaxID=76758 RepID=UPI003209ED85
MRTAALVRYLVKWRTFNALFVIVFVLGLSPGLLDTRFDASIESFLPQGNVERLRYDSFKKVFGDDRMVVVALPRQVVFSPEVMGRLKAVTEQIEGMADVARATSIATVNIIYGQDQSIDILPAAQALAQPGSYDVRRITEKLLNSPLYQRDLISLDGQIPALLIEARTDSGEGKFERILSALDAQMIKAGFPVFYVAGEPVVEHRVTSDMWSDLKTFIPLTSLVLFVLLMMLLRNLGDVLVVLTVVTLCVVLLLGAMGMLGVAVNAVTVGLPSVLMCIAVLDCLHILDTYRQALSNAATKVQAIERSLSVNIMPCFLTSATTAIGFLSLAVSEVAPIRAFGVIAALAAIAAYVISLMVMPSLLECIPARLARKVPDHRYATWVRRLEPLYRSRRTLPVLTALVLLVALIPLGRLHVEASFLNFIDPTTPVRSSTDYIERQLGGVASLEVSLRTAEKGGVLEPAVLSEIVQLQAFIASLQGVDKSVSVVDFLKDIHREMNGGDARYYTLPQSREAAEQYVFTYSLAGPDNELKSFLDYDNQTTRIRIRMQQLPYVQMQQVIEALQTYTTQHSSPAFTYSLTSYSVIQAAMVQKMVQGMWWGIGFAIACMFAAFLMLTRSLWVSGIAVVANTMPLIVAFGVMGALGLSINIGTSMIACIIFGLVVDASLHCFYHVKDFPLSATPEEMTRSIFEGVGEALLTGGLVLCSGFLVLVMGESYFTRLFGAFCALAILISVFCNAVGIPYLLYHFYGRRQPDTPANPVLDT